MGGLKTFSMLLCLAVLISGTGHMAPAGEADQRLRFFATCAGRLSALMEHQWLFDGPGSEQTRAQRAAMIDVLMAMTPSGAHGSVLNWRIEAKAAHATLLTRATFSEDPATAGRARRLARRHVAECTAHLLG